jgi:hypothetical protein
MYILFSTLWAIFLLSKFHIKQLYTYLTNHQTNYKSTPWNLILREKPPVTHSFKNFQTLL